MPDAIITQADEKMAKAIESLNHEFSTVRTGRASGVIFEKIMIDYYGTATPLLQLAAVTSPAPQLILISPYDKSILKTAEKAILASDLGLNPSNDGTVIRVPFPALNEERRRELVKLCHAYAEQARVAVRNVRRDANDTLKKREKAGDLSQDDVHRGEEQIQKKTDAFIAKVDDLLKHKEQEIMEV